MPAELLLIARKLGSLKVRLKDEAALIQRHYDELEDWRRLGVKIAKVLFRKKNTGVNFKMLYAEMEEKFPQILHQGFVEPGSKLDFEQRTIIEKLNDEIVKVRFENLDLKKQLAAGVK